MRARQTALGGTALQIPVDDRQPGFRPETLLARFLEQVLEVPLGAAYVLEPAGESLPWMARPAHSQLTMPMIRRGS